MKNNDVQTAASEYAQAVEKQKEEWLAIMNMSDQLLQLAQQKNWDRLSSLHARRDEKINAFFAQAVAQDIAENIQTDIQKICSQDRVIVELIQQNRDELGAEAQRLQSLRNRVQHYISAGETDL